MDFLLRYQKGVIYPEKEDSKGVHIYLLKSGRAQCEVAGSSLIALPNDVFMLSTSLPGRITLLDEGEVLCCYCSDEFMKRINHVPMMKTNFYYWTKNAGVYHQNYFQLPPELAQEIFAFSAFFEEKSIEKQFFIIVRFLAVVCTVLQKNSLYNLSEVESPVVQQVLRYIDDHLSEKMSLEKISNAHYVSVSKLQRIFNKEVHLSLNTYVLYRRLEEAKRYIIYHRNLTKAWEGSGFTEYSNFSKSYKTIFGISPKKFCEQQMLKGDGNDAEL